MLRTSHLIGASEVPCYDPRKGVPRVAVRATQRECCGGRDSSSSSIRQAAPAATSGVPFRAEVGSRHSVDYLNIPRFNMILRVQRRCLLGSPEGVICNVMPLNEVEHLRGRRGYGDTL